MKNNMYEKCPKKTQILLYASGKIMKDGLVPNLTSKASFVVGEGCV